MKKIIRVFAIMLIIIGIILIGYYGWVTLQSFLSKNLGKSIFDDLKSSIIIAEGDKEDTTKEDDGEEDLSVYKDLIDKLREGFQNEDVVAYISYEEANIDYPVVQGIDNFEYLRKGVDGKYSASGSIILDTDNDIYLNDVASILYGHCMNNRSMFGKLERHVREVGLGEQFYIYTETERITYKTIAYGVISPDDRTSYIVTGEEGHPEFLKRLSSKSEKYELCSNDNKFVTLITCTYLSGGVKERFGVTGAEVNREPYILNNKEVLE